MHLTIYKKRTCYKTGFYFRLPPFWPSNRFLGGMLKDTKKATNSLQVSCLKFYYFRNIPMYSPGRQVEGYSMPERTRLSVSGVISR